MKLKRSKASLKMLPIKIAALTATITLLISIPHETRAQTNPIYSRDGKPSSDCIDQKTLKVGPCPESQRFIREAQFPLEEAFNSKNYSELDRLYSRWCTGSDRFPDGRWLLAWYTKTFFGYFQAWKNWDKHLNQFMEWQKKYPESEAARLLEAVYWRSYAWNARGSGYANSVSKEGWQLFHQRISNAQIKLASVSSNCPAKYPVMIDNLIDASASEPDLRTVYNEAIKRFPEYHSIYFAMSRHYLPEWGGSISAYEKFANEAASTTRSFEGSAMYARLYWLADHPGDIPFTNTGKPPSWPKLKQALDDLTTKYPDSQHNLGYYLSVACRSSDSNLYRRIRNSLGNYAAAAETYDALEVCDLRHKWNTPSR